MSTPQKTLLQEAALAIRSLREWVQAVPEDIALPAMPGMDGDWLDDVEDQLRKATQTTPLAVTSCDGCQFVTGNVHGRTTCGNTEPCAGFSAYLPTKVEAVESSASEAIADEMVEIAVDSATNMQLDWLAAELEEFEVEVWPTRDRKAYFCVYKDAFESKDAHQTYASEDTFYPSAECADGGPILWREEIATVPNSSLAAKEIAWTAYKLNSKNEPIYSSAGRDPLTAGMRCFIKSKKGEVVKIPKALCELESSAASSSDAGQG